jgi:DNA-3-methyladenine glycosylase II
MLPPRLDSAEALNAHLGALLARDPRLATVAERAGAFELRNSHRDFAGLARIVCGQQLSVASARAIWERFAALPGALTPSGYLKLDEATVRGVGFSGGKFRTLRAVAEAGLDFAAIDAMPMEDAVAALTAIKGIGPWTAELYLMFCAGHPDIFPVGDLALQKAVGHGLGLRALPEGERLRRIARKWAPHRATAALLFWRYFAAMRGADGVIL